MKTLGTNAAVIAATLTTAALVASGARAAENGNSQYTGGASQFFGAAIPPYPGLYALSQTNFYSADRINDNDGDDTGLDTDINATAEALRFLYVPGAKLGDADLWGMLVVPIVHLNARLATPGGFVIGDENTTALADIIIAGGAAWHFGHHTLVAGVDIAAPTGRYDVSRAINVGLNHWSIQPTFGYKYYDPKGFDLSLVPRFVFNFENPDTNYRSGTELFVDFAVGWNVGQFKLGAVGYLYQQISDDEGPGVAADGHRGSAFAIGPSITYAFNPGFQVSASWQHEVAAKNRSQGDSIWINFATKF